MTRPFDAVCALALAFVLGLALGTGIGSTCRPSTGPVYAPDAGFTFVPIGGDDEHHLTCGFACLPDRWLGGGDGGAP